MKKDQMHSPLSSLDFNEDSPVADWFRQNGWTILYGLGAIIALIAVLFWMNAGKQAKAEQDYIQAMIVAQRIVNYPDTDREAELRKAAVPELIQIMDRHPELHAKYDGQLAQYYLLESNPSEAQKFFSSALERVKQDQLPDYNKYPQNSIIIAEQEFKTALTNALQMNAEMEKKLTLPLEQRGFGDTLYVFNLIRIAQLHQQLGNTAEEKQAWAKLTQLADKQGNGLVKASAVEDALAHFEVQGVNLMNYIHNLK